MELVLVIAAGVAALAVLAVALVRRRRARLSASAVNRIILRRLHLALDAASAGAWEWRLGLPSLRASGLAPLLDAASDAVVEVRTWEAAVHPDDREHWRRSFEEAIDAGESWTCLHRVVHRSGAVRWLDARAEPIRGSAGSIDGMLGVCVDVTERQERAQRARRAALVSEAVAEAATALTALADEPLIWAEATERAQQVFGCDRAAVIAADDVAPTATDPGWPEPAWTDPASGIRLLSGTAGPAGAWTLLVPIDIAGAREADLALAWDAEQPLPDRAWLAAVDRFAATIAMSLVIARRQQASSERDRLARRLQAGLMPTAGVDEGPLRVQTAYQPGEDRLMLGGDFLDVMRMPDGRVGFILGDVCGHGPAEAALGTILRSAWTGIASTTEQDPAAWLATLDRILLARREQGHTFVTAVAGICDARAGTLAYAVAGHPPPLLVHAASGEGQRTVVTLDEGAGPALGLPAPGRARTAIAPLPVDAAVLAVTDGLFEGRGQAGTRLTHADVADLAARLPLAQDDALRRFIAAVTALHAGPLDDDAAALLISRR